MNFPIEWARSLAGGVLIGSGAILLLWTNGQLAGISGMLSGLLRAGQNTWRYAFLSGLVSGGLLSKAAGWTIFAPLEGRSTGALIAAGLLVGFGTQLGSGCTSGHGVCGLGRFSGRSLAATLTFMAAGAATVFLVRHFLGGTL